jgi:hypothetical protein
MKCNPWTKALVAAGLVSIPAVTQAEESPSSVLTAISSTTLSGYVDTSAQWNIGTGNGHTPNYAFGGSSKADGFNLNVVKMTLERPINPDEAWSAGYKVDLIYGPDANVLATSSSGEFADFGVKQAYVSLHAPVGNGLDFKLGVWDTIIGYEVFESVNNPNFTRSYGYTIEPTTHTGFQGTYVWCPYFSTTLGVANTFGPKINERAFPTRAESYKTYMGSMTFTAPTNWGFLGGSTLSGGVINGFNSTSPSIGLSPADQTSWYVGATFLTPVTGLKFGASYDYAGVSGQPVTDGNSGYANAVGVYAAYQLTEKLGVYARGEYASTSVPTTLGSTKLVEGTLTLQYDLWKNVLSRLEFRWDHSADGTHAFGGTTSDDEPTLKNSYILLASLAYKF